MLLILSADQKVSGEHLCDYVGHILSGIVTVETCTTSGNRQVGNIVNYFIIIRPPDVSRFAYILFTRHEICSSLADISSILQVIMSKISPKFSTPVALEARTLVSK